MGKDFRVRYYEDAERWVDDAGFAHNPLGPSYVAYDENGLKRYMQWTEHGKRHRVDGPAFEWTPYSDLFYLLDEKMPFEQWLEIVRYGLTDERVDYLTKTYGNYENKE